MTKSEQKISWDDFRLVKHIAQSGGLTGASRALLIDHSTVFRRLGQIENKLGQRLFVRHRTGYTPTPVGEEIVAIASRMDDEIADWIRRVSEGPVIPTGELRIRIREALLAHLLVPIFADFRNQYPKIRLDVVLESENSIVLTRDVAVAVTATSTPPEDAYGRQTATIAWALYGSVEHYPPGSRLSPTAFMDHMWVSPAGRLAGLRPAKFIERHVPQESIAYRVDDISGVADAIAAGVGIGFLPCFVGDGIAKLTRLSELQGDFVIGLWVLTHQHLQHDARVSRLLAHLDESLSRLRPLVDGTAGAEGKPTSAACLPLPTTKAIPMLDQGFYAHQGRLEANRTTILSAGVQLQGGGRRRVL
jgi:DNA-binding transcriptional LysR family regulator